jgi:hypothetical protein
MSEDDAVQLKPTDAITVLEGFDAVRIFLETLWHRQGKDAAEIAFVLGATRWEDGTHLIQRSGKTGSPQFTSADRPPE